MTGFFEVFQPGSRHWREQQELEKVLVIDTKKGGSGPRPLDIDSGVVHLVMPRRRDAGRAPSGGEGDTETDTESGSGTP